MGDYHLDRLIAENNEFFFGTVLASDAGTYTVQVATNSNYLPALMSGIVLGSVMASMIGMKACVLPQPSARVFCYKMDAVSCLILGVVPPSETTDLAQSFHARTVIGAGDGKSCENNIQGYADGSGISKVAVSNVNRPTDIVDGEYALANEFGVLLGMFQHFAVLKASELAQIQAFIFDDLVRIVSHNFEHFTCMGGSKVFQDGRDLTHEINLTHDASEAMGNPSLKTDSPDVPTINLNGESTPDDTKDFFELKNERLTQIDRLRGFVGALGDFIHLILSKPAEGQQRALDGKDIATFDRGLASVKLGLDGSMTLRSLGGISLEKTNWIRVPHRVKAAEEKEVQGPTQNTPKNFTFDSSRMVRNIPFLHFLQLRDYLAFSIEGETYRKFTESSKFHVNNDPSKETPVGEATPIAPDRTGSYYPSTSGFYNMPNGGITIRDAWGSSIVMEGGNIYIQPSKDLIFQPLRNMVAKVGQKVTIASQSDIDLSSTSGGFRLKTDTAQYLYSAKSGIVVHSDADAPSEYYPKEGVVTNIGGILLHAPNAGIATHAAHSLFKTDENCVIKSNMCMIDASDRVLLRSDNGFDVFTTGDMLISAGKNLVGFTEGTAIFVGLQNTALGVEKQNIAVGGFGPVQGLFEATAFDEWKAKMRDLATGDFQRFSFGYREDTAFDALQFRFLPSQAYGINEMEDVIPQTLAQQEDAALSTLSLTKWEEKPVNDTYPYPGAELTNMYATAELSNLQFDPTTQDTYNKAIEHSVVGKLNFTDLFTDYKVYA